MAVRHWIGRMRTAEAAVALTLARLALLIVPFRILARPLGRLDGPATLPSVTRDEARRAHRIRVAIDRATRRLPWHSTSLHRALAGAVLLRSRGLPSRVTFGVARDPDGIKAHAWLHAGQVPISGVREASQFTPLASFDHRPARG